jgi:hypothetical protein
VKLESDSLPDFYNLISDDDEMHEASSASPGPCPMHDNEASVDDKPLQAAAAAVVPTAAGGAAKPKDEAKPKDAKPKNDKAPRAPANRGCGGSKGVGKNPASKVVYAEMFGVWEKEIVMRMRALHDQGRYSFADMTPEAKMELRTMPKELALKALDEMLDTTEHIHHHNVYFTTVLDGMRKMHKIASVDQILKRWKDDNYAVPEIYQEHIDEYDKVHFAWDMEEDKWSDFITKRMDDLKAMKRCTFSELSRSDAFEQLQTLPGHVADLLLVKLRDETGAIADVGAYISKNAKRLRSVHDVESPADVWKAMQAELDRVDDTEDDADADEE